MQRCVTMRSSKPSNRDERTVDRGLGRELLDERLIELAPLGRQRDDARPVVPP